MRVLLVLWFVPIALLLAWYTLAANDWNMGTRMFSREMHDLVFGLYGKILGMDPKDLPAFAAKAIVVDSLIVLAIAAFRWRKSWWPKVSQYFRSELPVGGQGSPAE